MSEPESGQHSGRTAYRLTIRGRVQGIGFRPVIARLATRFQILGSVTNSELGIIVHAESSSDHFESFVASVSQACPTTGRIDSISIDEVAWQNFRDFRILASVSEASLSTSVPLDRVTCTACLAEFLKPWDRRADYLLNSCCDCGPRYSIISQMPYERPLTSMQTFAFCSECEFEYTNPLNRRFHAQTTCCRQCGPHVSNVEEAIEQLQMGEVIIVKGIGGYQLLALANQHRAIKKVRELKQRKSKPLAIMVSDLESAAKFGKLTSAAIHALTSSAGPIVIVPHKLREATSENLGLDLVGDLDSIGLMLPTSLLHRRLVMAVGPLVVSSANLEGDPIIFHDAGDWKSSINSACVVVDHNRPIIRPIDDSVIRIVLEKQATIRLARGLAPLPLDLGTYTNSDQYLAESSGTKVCTANNQMLETNSSRFGHRNAARGAIRSSAQVLAVGGHQKVAVALYNGQQAVLGPHLGDMDSLASRVRFDEQVRDWLSLYNCQPQWIAHDSHPDYFTTRWAQDYAQAERIQCLAIQHHAAHCAASLIEPRWWDENVIAVTWDGTGWGDDGTIWGGEGLTYHAGQITRVASLRPFVLPGGELAVRQPWRIAAALLKHPDIHCPTNTHLLPRPFEIDEVLKSETICPTTTSMGRLFDAAAVLILNHRLPGITVDYEGHFAALLEADCDPNVAGAYKFPLLQQSPQSTLQWQWDWVPLFNEIIRDLDLGTKSSTVATRFHRAVATAAVSFINALPEERVVLSGGVFQNRVLVESICQSKRLKPGKQIATPSLIPVNDGGLASGQLLLALKQLQ